MYMSCEKCSCSELKLAKHLHTFFVLTLNLRNPVLGSIWLRSSSQSKAFFQHRVWPVKQGKSYLHGIALPDFYIVSSFFYKKSKQAMVPTFVWLFRDNATSATGPVCDEGTNLC